MKLKTLLMIVICILLRPNLTIARELAPGDVIDSVCISVSPEPGGVDVLDQITVYTDSPDGFGAFVYMPFLYSTNEDGSLGAEVSACELIDDSVRGKNAVHFKVLNPPTRAGKYTFMIKTNSFSLNSSTLTEADKEDENNLHTTEKKALHDSTKSKVGRSHFINFPVDLKRDTLRILHISNSYGGNLLNYVDDLAKAARIDVDKVLVERLVYSGGSFKNWVDVYNDKNPNLYWYFKMTGNLNINLPGWEGSQYDGTKFRMILEDNKWDIVVLNQASYSAPFYEKWESHTNEGYLPELLDIIRRHQPEATVGMLLIHSYAENYEGNSPYWTTDERWERICEGVESMKSTYNINFIVPYGTAIQNLRLTDYNNIHDLTGDGIHLASGLAQYTAGCCYFETVFTPRFELSVWGNPLRVTDPVIKNTDKFADSVLPVDDKSAEIAQKAAFLAVHNMFEMRNPYLTDLTEYKYGDELNQEEYHFDFELTSFEIVEMVKEKGAQRIYGPTGLLLGTNMSEEEWSRLPEGLYIRNGEKIYKGKRRD